MVMDTFYNVLFHRICLPRDGTTKVTYSPFENGLSPHYLVVHKELVSTFLKAREDLNRLIKKKELWGWDP